MTTAAIVAAAGRSSRMQAFKPLLPLGQSTLIENTILSLRQGGADPIIVLTGREAGRLEKHLADMATKTGPVVCLHNENWAVTDMLHSVKLGLRQLPASCGRVLFVPGDVPLFTGNTVAKMLQCMDGSQADALAPVHLGHKGHPVLIHQRIVPCILEDSGEMGLKGVLQRQAKHFQTIDVDDWGVLLDADVPSDHALLCLLREAGEQGSIYRHSMVVAQLAVRLGAKLNVAGHRLDLLVIELAALLHDVERAQKNHAGQMARRLSALGLERLGAIVGGHMLLPPEERESISETSVVYLADKMALEDSVVAIEQRFAPRLCASGAAGEAARLNYRVARHLLELFEKEIGDIGPVRLMKTTPEHFSTGWAGKHIA